MTKYRKKPVVIEAWLFNGYPIEREGVPAWVQTNTLWKPNEQGTKGYLLIITLEGDMKAQEGDWIIRGIQGEIYSCKPDIFKQTYEKVAESAP